MTGVERNTAAPEVNQAHRPERPAWRGLRAWVRALFEIRSVTPPQRATVLREISEGSQPTVVYYVLLGISEVLAGFALIVDSDALADRGERGRPADDADLRHLPRAHAW